ncbi:phosphatidylinositol glycan anchor biosynthesis class F [Cotesia typhae]|uniref:phosphatidylinositol glycan anchor biosynthesis class F n=1 Tax=Cotesia typhae TaxID=2053667 RepID=UPI003D691088
MLNQRLLLYYCLFTCIYFPSILILLKINDTLYNVGKYKFIPILIILMFAELMKLLFSSFYNSRYCFDRIDAKLLPSKSKKSWSKFFKDTIKFLIIAVTLFIVYYAAIVLFGAPLTTHHEETSMLALILTALTFVPPSLHLGVDNALCLLTGAQVPSNNIIAQAMYRNIKCTLVGTWCGAIVIPLDWDRPWQEWPIPCVIGAFVGYIVAHCIHLFNLLPNFKFFKSKRLHR